MNPVVYSVGYNTPFVLASYILSAIILVVLYKRYANQLVRIQKEKVVTPSSETAASV